MIFRAAVLALAIAAGALGAQTPQNIRLGDAGSGVGPRVLAEILSRPYDVVAPGSTRYLIERGPARQRTLVSIGRDVVVEGDVRGDLVVVGADLYMHPGGRIGGRAIAYGGGIYESALATVQGGVTSYHDFTYDVETTPDAYVLRYRALNPVVTHTFAFGGIYGLSAPSYDRTNGVSLPVSGVLTPYDRLSIAPGLTYRSQLGRLDPRVDVSLQLDRRTTVRAAVARGTFSNDAWIRPDLLNSAHYLLLGNDTRNYYRARRGDLVVDRTIEHVTSTVTPYLGVRIERGGSVRPLAGVTGGPWAFRGRHDADDVLRLNPLVDDALIRTAVGGLGLQWASQGVTAAARLDAEAGDWNNRNASAGAKATSAFQQATLDGTIGFPTFGTQRLDVDLHAVATAGTPPRERFAYVGGPGTLPTIELLELGGDELVFTAARYSVPLDRVQLPFAGAPILSFREILGGAGVSGFPAIRQATGVRLSAGFLYGEILVDPSRRRGRFGAGLSTGR